MTPTQLQQVIEALKGTIVETVNGKIDNLTNIVNANKETLKVHIEEHRADTLELKGFLELTKGAKVLGEIGKWISSIAIFGFALKWLLIKE